MKNLHLVGSQKTKQFYNTVGWQEENGRATDNQLFGSKEDGPIRQHLHQVHTQRARESLMRAVNLTTTDSREGIKLLECGCGGNPAVEFLDLCSTYTGVDFSEVGLEVAKRKLKGTAIPCEVTQADSCQLPFDNEQFDAIYSAHMLYHIPEAEAQASALREMIRVLKPNGVLVLLTANPRPWLFPIRFVKRLVADTPWLSDIANALRRNPPLPYNPMQLSWFQRQLSPYGSVEFITSSLPSTAFHQGVTEYTGLGKQLWQGIQWLDINAPQLSAYLGNYAQVTVLKSVKPQ